MYFLYKLAHFKGFLLVCITLSLSISSCPPKTEKAEFIFFLSKIPNIIICIIAFFITMVVNKSMVLESRLSRHSFGIITSQKHCRCWNKEGIFFKPVFLFMISVIHKLHKLRLFHSSVPQFPWK